MNDKHDKINELYPVTRFTKTLDIDKEYDAFHAKHEHIGKFIVDDMQNVINDHECLLSHEILLNNTLDVYKSGKVEYIGDTYNHNIAYRDFLYELSQSELYSQILAQKNPLYSFLDIMGNLIEKGELPGGMKGQNKGNNAVDDLIRRGKLLLDLMKDKTMRQMMKQPQDGDSGDNDSEDGKDKYGKEKSKMGLKEIKKFIDRMKSSDIIKLHLSNLYKNVALYGRSKRYIPSLYPNNIEVDTMKHVHQVHRLLPSQLAIPKPLLMYRIAKKNALIKDYRKQAEEKNLLYILLDMSSSMGDEGESIGGYKKHFYSSAIAISYLRKLVDNEDYFAFRFFAGQPHGLHEAENTQEASELIETILKQGLYGCTEIGDALSTAIEDIKEAKNTGKKLKDVNILLISDGEDNINQQEIKSQLKANDIKLYSAFINSKERLKKFHYDQFREISEKFIELSSIEDFIKLAQAIE